MQRKNASAADNMLPFAAREVRSIMANLDLNVTQLGRLCGVNRNTAGKWVNGRSRLPIATLRWLQSLETAYMAVCESKGYGNDSVTLQKRFR